MPGGCRGPALQPPSGPFWPRNISQIIFLPFYPSSVVFLKHASLFSSFSRSLFFFLQLFDVAFFARLTKSGAWRVPKSCCTVATRGSVPASEYIKFLPFFYSIIEICPTMEGCLPLSRRIRSFAGQYPLFFVSVILLDWTSGPVLFAKLLVFAE